jgi:hypothetical protein
MFFLCNDLFHQRQSVKRHLEIFLAPHPPVVTCVRLTDVDVAPFDFQPQAGQVHLRDVCINVIK